jgi:hypothetical protein
VSVTLIAMYWTVMRGGHAYNEAEEPEVLEEGTIVLKSSGQSFAAGTWQKFDRKGELPKSE